MNSKSVKRLRVLIGNRSRGDIEYCDSGSPQRRKAFTRQMNPYRFENAPLLAAFSNRPGFGNGLDRCRVNRRRNRIENNAVSNETAFV